MYITLTAMKFYFIIKSLFSIRFFQKNHALAVDYSSDIVVTSSSIDTLNVTYRSHMLILLGWLPQIYVHSSPDTSLITGNALKI